MTTASHGLFHALLHLAAPLALLLGALLLAGRILFPAQTLRLARGFSRPLVGVAAAGAAFAVYAAILAVRMYFPGFIDPGEPLISSIAYFALHGGPVYRNFIPYGPYCYLPYAVALRLFPPHIVDLKWVVIIADLVFLSLLFAVYRRRLGTAAGAWLTAAAVLAGMLMAQSYVLQIRGDIFIFIAVALALWAALGGKRASWVWLSLALTLGIGVKATAVLYLLAPCALFLKRQGLGRMAVAVVVAALLNLAPFAIPGLSFSAYSYWLLHMSHEMRSMKELAGNLFTTCVLLAPAVLIGVQMARVDRRGLWDFLRSRALFLAAFLGGLLVLDVIAAKAGGGRHHLAPFFVVAGYLAADMYAALREMRAPGEAAPSLLLAWGWCALAVLLGVGEWQTLELLRSLDAVERPQAIALSRDVHSILARFPGERLELGAGSGTEDLNRVYSPQYAAVWLVFQGDPYNFDTSSAADNEMLRLPFPEASLRDVAGCETQVWLIPKGQTPFATESIYSRMYPKEYPGHVIFTDQIRQSFASRRVLIGSSRFFDLYACRSAHGAPNA